ncbi:MAG TPA: glycyl-radical enzyme activating protein [Deltaproteobacteria bacterium]|nr:glycyl-radical enzyme activating protein [Deltaproteobacteria bacterium]
MSTAPQIGTHTSDKALIFEVKGNSLDDGPGIRTVIFFKGCPLNCVWCHNPEGKSKKPEISFDKNECIMCGTCLEICPEGALDRENPFYIDPARCTLCMKCIDKCPSSALSLVGMYWGIDDLVAVIEKDLPFFKNSGGGVTLSGGEPTMHMDFISLLLRRIRPLGINTLIETCGLFDLRHFMDKVYPWLSTIYFDIKILDEPAHRKYCGASNREILHNLEYLHRSCEKDGIELLIRIPLIPEITATRENLASIARYLKDLGILEIDILPYNPLWPEKCDKIGIGPCSDDDMVSVQWMSHEEIERCRAVFDGFNLR